MRLSVKLLVFFIVFNAWAGILQDFDVDDQLGFSAELGDTSELEAVEDETASDVQTGSPVTGTIFGVIIASATKLAAIIGAVAPGVQMLVNVVPSGPPTAIVGMLSALVPVIITVDILNFLRGLD